MKTKILFLIALLVGLNSYARSNVDYVNSSTTTCEEDLVINNRYDRNILVSESKSKNKVLDGGYTNIPLTITKTHNSITVNWSEASPCNYETKYKIRIVTVESGAFKNVEKGKINSYTFTELNPLTAYTISITELCGALVSRQAPTQTVYTTKDTGTVKPFILTFSKIKGNSITADWGDGGNSCSFETKYTLTIIEKDGGAIKKVELKNVKTHTFKELKPLKAYNISITRFCGALVSEQSSIYTVYTKSGTTEPWTDASLTFSKITKNSITVNWKHGASCDGMFQPKYTVFWQEKVGNNFDATAFSRSKALKEKESYSILELKPFSVYIIHVVKSCMLYSSKSQTYFITTERQIPNSCRTPTALKMISQVKNVVKASWNPVSGIASYEVAIRTIEWTSPTKFKTTKWVSLPVSTNSIITDIIKPYKKYQIKVKSICGKVSSNYSPLISFTSGSFKSPTEGPCDCKVGNKEVTENNAATHFYCDKVTGKVVVTQSSGMLKFKSKVVELNPGFETKITGTGSFIAVAFDPNTCQESAGAPQQGQKSATQMSTENSSVVVPKKYIVYPNPNRGSFSIDFKEKDVIIRSITVYDMFGVRILHRRYNRRLDVEQYSLRLAKSGLYKIAIRTASGVEYETLLVEF